MRHLLRLKKKKKEKKKKKKKNYQRKRDPNMYKRHSIDDRKSCVKSTNRTHFTAISNAQTIVMLKSTESHPARIVLLLHDEVRMHHQDRVFIFMLQICTAAHCEKNVVLKQRRESTVITKQQKWWHENQEPEQNWCQKKLRVFSKFLSCLLYVTSSPVWLDIEVPIDLVTPTPEKTL